ncbi:protein FAF-like, chloroplastic [Impatiens glandulifera]|uniref:protein FAF-like, chloroplastic n=1 Tax=Impatiens glandulifera TaxID=253017 RepID=UPI001FB0CC6F|nr:protein FAF-like, chloroplastic [Impatiens glandulifera]
MASATVGKLSLLLSSSPLQVEEETKAMIENHLGIVSILRSDHANSNMATANTLRRNLSADMSSRKWLAQNGLSSSSSSTSMKKIASSEQLSSLEDQINSRPGQDDVWMSIQLKNINNNNKKEVEKPDTWESILSQNAKEDHQYPNNITPPPYVHPLVKRSSSLSDKSLQICTESLGSETGSEDFSSYPSSETTSSDTEDQNKEEQQQQLKQTSQTEKQSVVVVDSASGREEWQPTKCMYSTRSTSTRSFPPPLSSLAQSAGPTLHMQSRRLHGRLVLEAVSVPSKNFFQAQRQDGRLVLKLNSNQNQDLSETNVVEDDFEEEEEDEEEVEEIVRQETKVKEVTVLMEQEPRLLQSVGTKVKEVTVLMEQQEPRLLPSMGTIMFQKIMRIDNVNPAWPNRFNRKINLSRVEMELELDQEEDATAQSLPHVARLIRSPATTTTVGTTGSFNAYDYFWRTKPTNNQQSPTEKNNNKLTNPHNSPKACERQELVFLRGNKGEYLVPLVTGCKDSRRSLLIWEPYCVATS